MVLSPYFTPLPLPASPVGHRVSRPVGAGRLCCATGPGFLSLCGVRNSRLDQEVPTQPPPEQQDDNTNRPIRQNHL
jgi:hypothetical protein